MTKKLKEKGEVVINVVGDAHPDASGFRQNHPDARGFAPGKEEIAKADGKWQSSHPDAHGWHHSSSG